MIQTDVEIEITSIEEFNKFIKSSYLKNPKFKEGFDQAIAHVQTMPSDTPKDIQHNWKGSNIDDLCDFFKSWYTWNPELSTGLEFIQRFSWLYYENQKGLEFVTKGTGLHMTYLFVEINARKMNSTKSIDLVKKWMDAIGVEKMKQYIIPKGGYQSFNEFFSRELKVARPISSPDDNSVVVSPADAIINMIDDNLAVNTSPLDVKTQQLNVTQLLDNSELAGKFKGGTAISCILMPDVYHRYHAPVSGKVVESKEDVAGEYFGIKDFPKLINGGNVGYGYDYSVFEHFRRGYTIIKTEDYGHVAMIPVGLNTISSVVFHDKFKNINLKDTPLNITKGEEIGYFQYGGSMNILLFEKGCFPSVRIPQGQIIGKMEKKPIIKESIIGKWKDLNGTVITIGSSNSKPGYFEIRYANGRGPFIGSSFSEIIPPIINVDFTDDIGLESGQVTPDWLTINWGNGTKWVKLQD